MIRVGVIGTGYMGSNHVRVYSQLENVELVGVMDVDSAKADSLAKRYHTRSFSSLEKFLKNDLDLVSVVVPSSKHYEVAMAVIENGINVLVEKPITLETSHANELIKKAKSAGVKLAVGHIERFNPAVTKLKEIITSGVLGEIDVVSSERLNPMQAMADSGVIFQMGIHDLDIINSSIMPIKSIHAFQRLREDKEDYCFAFFKLQKGVGHSEFSWRCPRKIRTLRVIGEKAVAEMDFITQDLRVYQNKTFLGDSFSDQVLSIIGSSAIIPDIKKEEPLLAELRHMVGCVENDTDPLVKGEDGLKALELALLTKKSADEQREIEVR